MSAYINAFKNYANFEGRASRTDFWMFVLVHVVLSALLVVVDAVFGTPIALVYLVLSLLPSLAIAVRRLHDTDRTGYCLLIGLIPVIGVVLLLFYVQAGTRRSNRFGEPVSEVVPEVEPAL